MVSDTLKQLNEEVIETLKKLRTEVANIISEDKSKRNDPDLTHIIETVRQWEQNAYSLRKSYNSGSVTEHLGEDFYDIVPEREIKISETINDKQLVMSFRKFLEIEAPAMQETLDGSRPSSGLSPR